MIEGAEALPNTRGTAPGQLLEHQGRTIVLLPGPPGEMKPMFDEHVLPRLRAQAGASRVVRRRVLRIAGMPESGVDEVAAPVYSRFENPKTTILGAPGQVELHLVAARRRRGGSGGRIEELARLLREALPGRIFSEDGRELPRVVVDLLRERSLTLALAESCTGGLLSARLTEVPGVSAVLDRAVVSYANRSKVEALGVDAALLERHGAVSEEVAAAMAAGVMRAARSDVGVAITGIAGPDGGTQREARRPRVRGDLRRGRDAGEAQPLPGRARARPAAVDPARPRDAAARPAGPAAAVSGDGSYTAARPMLLALGVIVAAYLIGSIPFSFLVARAFGVADVRRVGSGNVGATNVLRNAGRAAGAVALGLDVAKGALAVALALRLAPGHPVLPAVAAGVAVVGHVYPVWLGLRGGKGVATGLGAFAVLEPVGRARRAADLRPDRGDHAVRVARLGGWGRRASRCSRSSSAAWTRWRSPRSPPPRSSSSGTARTCGASWTAPSDGSIRAPGSGREARGSRRGSLGHGARRPRRAGGTAGAPVGPGARGRGRRQRASRESHLPARRRAARGPARDQRARRGACRRRDGAGRDPVGVLPRDLSAGRPAGARGRQLRLRHQGSRDRHACSA